jgi:hypothetical protein
MHVERVFYDVNWARFRKKGDCVFFPALDPKRAKREIGKQLRQLGLTPFVMKGVIVEGVGGVRVWRL